MGKTWFMCGVVASPKSKSGKSDDAPHADVKIERARRRCCGCICQTCPPPANPVSGDESKTAGSDRVMVEPIDAPGDQSAASGEGISLARRRSLVEAANSLFHLQTHKPQNPFCEACNRATFKDKTQMPWLVQEDCHVIMAARDS